MSGPRDTCLTIEEKSELKRLVAERGMDQVLQELVNIFDCIAIEHWIRRLAAIQQKPPGLPR